MCKVSLLISVATLLAIAPGALAFDGVHGTSCNPSMSEYNLLKTNMSVREAEQVLGCQGSELSRSDMAGFTTVAYGWDGSGSLGANIMLMFQNDELIQRAQLGLR